MMGEGHLTLEPVSTHPPELLLKAQGIRWAIFDVDGVLTDGRIYIGERGVSSRPSRRSTATA